jgi:CRP/FNR family transcriptional regulator, cyclic AMP receptor protein
MPAAISVKTTTKPPTDTARAIARRLLGKALGFRDCLGETLDALVAGGQIRTLAKGEPLARRGAPFDMICLIVQGSLEASLPHREGHRHLISFLQPGDVAGMISMIDGLGHVNDLWGRDAGTTVLLVPGDLIRGLRAHDPALQHAFELQLAFRSRLLYERLAADPSMPLEARLARLLTILAGLYGLPRPDGVLLSIKISQFDLADWLGVSRQRINFAVQQLKEEQLIRSSYSAITVVNLAGLTARASV